MRGITVRYRINVVPTFNIYVGTIYMSSKLISLMEAGTFASEGFSFSRLFTATVLSIFLVFILFFFFF